MTSATIDAINAHRAAWQAFQDAPEGDAALAAEDYETEALLALLRTVPQDQADLAALKSHLDWWVVEEAQRRDCEPELFMLHAVIDLAGKAGAHESALVKRAFNAALDCPHGIDGSAVTLRVDPTKQGNALSQLHQRIATALEARG